MAKTSGQETVTLSITPSVRSACTWAINASHSVCVNSPRPAFLPQGGTHFQFVKLAVGRLAGAGIHKGHRLGGTRLGKIELKQDAGVEVAHQKR